MKNFNQTDSKETLANSSLIKEVFNDNFEEEIKRLSTYLDRFKYISIVTIIFEKVGYRIPWYYLPSYKLPRIKLQVY